jgi:anthranilate/para-aminobenzoate synthase component II
LSEENNMLLMIDNYDSFTYNLVQYFGELGEDVKVFRNDAITLEGDRRHAAGPHRDLARPLLAGRGRHLGGDDQSSPARSRCSASASATRASARPSAARSSMPSN